MRVAICDDDPRDLQEIASLAQQILRQSGVPCEFVTYDSSAELLSAIRGGAEYHVLLLDVMMGELGGIELASALRGQGDATAIVFISSNREMALMGYEVSATRYLAKPVDPGKLAEALAACMQKVGGTKEILLPTTNGQRRILLEKLMYAEAWERGMRLFTADGEVHASLKISELEAMLPEERFVLCHRAYVVNMAFVQNIRRYELELKNGTCLPVSKYRYMEVKGKFFDYLKA